jgi:hypothetical protein
MTAVFVNPLVARWRAEADRLEKLGQQGAGLAREYADELEQAARQWELEALTLEAAAAESGYSYSHLQRLISGGIVDNVGRRGAPRVRRCDIPRKPRAGPRPRAVDLADELLARRNG